jgi:uncharacterized protein YndB with AHSA1/START domain
MALATEAEGAVRPEPLRTSRTFPAPREAVFKAWSSGERVKRWFCPAVFTIPDANVEMRPGGPFEVCMRAPDGTEHWTRGAFAEVTPFERLELDLHATDASGRILFYAYTEVDFIEVPGGTRMDVVQTYTLLTPEASMMVQGAPLGWSQTLDRLEQEVARIGNEAGEVRRSVVHAIFQLSRTWDAPVERVYRALTDPAAKAKWFHGPPGWEALERTMDVRPGGRERLKGRGATGVVSTFDAVYHDVIPNARLVYSYDMWLDARKISVSLATMELVADGPNRTTLKVTEQGAFLDGYDDAGSREHGTGMLIDALGASLKD